MTRWRMLALLFAARIGLGVNFQAKGSAGDQLNETFGLSYAQIGLMIGFFMAPGLFLALPAGYAGRFASDRLLCGLGLTGLAIGALVTAAAPGPDQIAVGRLVAGAGSLFAMLYFTKMAADWNRRRSHLDRISMTKVKPDWSRQHATVTMDMALTSLPDGAFEAEGTMMAREPNQTLALLIDSDNVSSKMVVRLLAEIANCGTSSLKKCLRPKSLPAIVMRFSSADSQKIALGIPKPIRSDTF